MNYDGIRYNNNYITNVICRLDFSEINSLKNDVKEEFVKELLDYNNNKNKILIQSENGFSLINIFEFEKEKLKISLSCNSLIFELKKYTTFEDFLNIFTRIFGKFEELYKNDISYKRLGLRFINNIPIDDISKIDYIDTNLFSIYNFAESLTNLSLNRYMEQLSFKSDDSNVIFNFGINNPNYPAPLIKKNDFILDMDVSTKDFPSEKTIIALLDNFHRIIQDLFEKSITSNLRSELNG